jgi:tRNA-splicing ligase RtcB (3'-phosphate/5'-hydroxy nucleic acid ligase)
MHDERGAERSVVKNVLFSRCHPRGTAASVKLWDVKARDLIKLGFKPGPAIGVAMKVIPEAKRALGARVLENDLKALASEPNAYTEHPHLALIAQALIEQNAKRRTYEERPEPAPYKIWGEGLEAGAVDQMKNAARLPVAVSGALMPDAHQGYGLPIGGVLATQGAVIPYAVGVDIACRMRLSVLDIPADRLEGLRGSLAKVLQRETKFGTGQEFKTPLEHEVLDRDWQVSPVTAKVFDKARGQLGTSGSGNHFVEFGILTLQKPDLGLEAGRYLALLSHSGSRGAGATVADHYSKLAMDRHPELPAELRRLAWLDLDSQEGHEYWLAMSLMGEYAAANHALIHQRVAKAAGARVLAGVENHHNFAWKETHGGRELIVHRKGATPAGAGVLGVIPGSMATPGFVVRGRGSEVSLNSASHGAGRLMSRTAAREKFRWNHFKQMLEDAGVQLLSAGIDEAPGVYKDIHGVMKAQEDLVDAIARFDPKIVKMADAGEKPED